jgi:hypothetical protein
MTIPEIAHHLRTQDNRITALPIFLVQQKRRRPVPEGYSDEGEWYDSENCFTITDPEEVALIETEEKEGTLHDRYQWIWYVDDWVFATACFTEEGAKAYIRINGHNLREPRIYVESGYRNEEWETIRAHLMGEPGGWKS